VDHFLIGLGLPASLVTALRLGSIGRLVLAALLGGAIGIERELKAKPAGLRTTMLICMGAAIFTELSILMSHLALGNESLRSDPARLAAQIIPGIGFIGAGAILHGRGRVTGITTAATLWVVTAIGIAVGSGAYVEAIGATVMVLLTLLLLGRAERFMGVRMSHRRYLAAVEPGAGGLERLMEQLESGKLAFKVETVEKAGGHVEVAFRVTGPREHHEKLVKHMIDDTGIRRFKRS
jgi:putative Mg2+ transporter-C (MgtC) family protein